MTTKKKILLGIIALVSYALCCYSIHLTVTDDVEYLFVAFPFSWVLGWVIAEIANAKG